LPFDPTNLSPEMRHKLPRKIAFIIILNHKLNLREQNLRLQGRIITSEDVDVVASDILQEPEDFMSGSLLQEILK